MKIVFAVFFAFTLAAAPLSAQTNATASGADSNAVIAPEESPAATNAIQASNAVAAVKAKPKKSSDDTTPVRIDHTGIHVGGKEPVDVNWGHDFGGLGFGTTLVAVLASFVLPVAIVVILPVAIIAIMFYTIHRRNRLVHENLRAMIEKGMPITPELVESLKGKHASAFNQPLFAGGHPVAKSGRSCRLLPGLILTGVGAALMINGHRFSGAGLIVLFIGIAFLIVWLVERMDRNNSQPPKQ